MEIKAGTTVEEAIRKRTGAASVFRKYNLDCAGCRGASEDTIEKVAVNNGMDVKTLLKELNSAAK